MPSTADLKKEAVSFLLQLDAEEKKRSEESFFAFFLYAWKVLEPNTPLVYNWHIRVLCDKLQAEIERIAANKPKTKDLIINILPRSLKSYLVSIMLCPWAWARFPHLKFINSSYSGSLATSHCLLGRRLIQSEWYQGHWGDAYQLTTDQNVKSHYENDKGGTRLATSVTGSIMGFGSDVFVCDDLLDPLEATSDAERSTANEYVDQTIFTRINDLKVGLKIIMMQRLHEDDPTGHVLTQDPDSWELYCFPAEGLEDVSPPEYRSQYTEINGKYYMFPGRFPPEVLAKALKSLKAYGYSGQFLQKPSPPEGGMFKRRYWRFWKPRGADLPPVQIKTPQGVHNALCIEIDHDFDEKINSWDMAFKDTKDSNYVVGQSWAKKNADKFMLDQRRDRLDFPETCDSVKALKKDNPGTTAVLVEDKANGPAALKQLGSEVEGLIPVAADISKEARATPASRQAQSGNIYLPHPAMCPWVWDFIDECAAFPTGRYDDQVDAMAHAINFLSDNKKKVWENFDQKKHFQNFSIDWADTQTREVNLYAGMYQKNSLDTYIVQAMWDQQKRHLWVFNEYKYPEPLPQRIVAELGILTRALIIQDCKMHGQQQIQVPLKSFQWYANKLMFTGEKDGFTTSDIFMRYNIYPNPSTADPFAAISTLSYMFFRNWITISSRCYNLARQVASWTMEQDQWLVDKKTSKPKGVDNGFCLALCLLANVLTETGKLPEEMVRYKHYTVERERMQKTRDLAAQGDQLGKLLRADAGLPTEMPDYSTDIDEQGPVNEYSD